MGMVSLRKGIILLIMILMLSPGISFSDEYKHNILFLQSYDPQNIWTRNISEGFYQTIDANRETIRVYEEYMDTKRSEDELDYDRFTTYFESKYENVEFSLIVTADNNAFDYVKTRNSDFFGQTPVVFVGLNPTSENTNLSSRYQGIYERIDIESTLNLVSLLHSDDSRIVIVTDETVTGKAVLENVKESVKSFNGPQNIEFYMSSNLDSIEKKLSGLDRNDAVILLLFNVDDQGKSYTYNEGLHKIYERSPAPIYGMWKFYLGQGIVGGYLTDGYAHGQAAANYVIAHLQGQPYTFQIDSELYFDHLELKKFNLDTKRLPDKAHYINKPSGPLLEIMPLIVTVALVAFLLSAIIMLWYLRQKEHIMNTSLVDEKGRLTSMLDEDLERLVAEKTSELSLANTKCNIMLEEYSELLQEKEDLQDKLQKVYQDQNASLFESKNLKEKMTQIDLYLRQYHIYAKGLMKAAVHENELMAELGVLGERMTNLKQMYEKGDMKRSDVEMYFKNFELSYGKMNERLLQGMKETKQLIDMNQISLDAGASLNIKNTLTTVQHAVELAMFESAGQNIKLDINIDEDLHTIRHSNYLTYIIIQLVSNCVCHGFENRETGQIGVKLHQEEGRIILEVTDNGLGINKKNIHKVFEPFFTVKRESGYLGIGLTNVKRVIEDIYNGKVHIYSELGEGTRVKLEFPAVEVTSNV